MCDPITMTVMAVGSTLLGAYGQIQAGKQEQQFANYQAAQAEADAKAERGAANIEAERIRQQAKRTRAAAVAALAGSGVDVNEGSALVIDREISKNSEEDAYLTILGGKDRALRLNAQAQVDRMRGRQARQAGYIGAFGSLLGEGSQIASGWKKAKTLGVV